VFGKVDTFWTYQPPRAPKKQLIADVVEDSEDLDDTHLSSGDDDDSTIPVAPLSSRPPLRAGKRALPKFGVDASQVFLVSYGLISK
jgi:hypothetical protein